MTENLSVTDELSDVHYPFLAPTSESICASHCSKQAAEQDELQVLLLIVAPTFLRLGSGVFGKWTMEPEPKLELLTEEE